MLLPNERTSSRIHNTYSVQRSSSNDLQYPLSDSNSTIVNHPSQASPPSQQSQLPQPSSQPLTPMESDNEDGSGYISDSTYDIISNASFQASDEEDEVVRATTPSGTDESGSHACTRASTPSHASIAEENDVAREHEATVNADPLSSQPAVETAETAITSQMVEEMTTDDQLSTPSLETSTVQASQPTDATSSDGPEQWIRFHETPILADGLLGNVDRPQPQHSPSPDAHASSTFAMQHQTLKEVVDMALEQGAIVRKRIYTTTIALGKDYVVEPAIREYPRVKKSLVDLSHQLRMPTDTIPMVMVLVVGLLLPVLLTGLFTPAIQLTPGDLHPSGAAPKCTCSAASTLHNTAFDTGTVPAASNAVPTVKASATSHLAPHPASHKTFGSPVVAPSSTSHDVKPDSEQKVVRIDDEGHLILRRKLAQYDIYSYLITFNARDEKHAITVLTPLPNGEWWSNRWAWWSRDETSEHTFKIIELDAVTGKLQLPPHAFCGAVDVDVLTEDRTVAQRTIHETLSMYRHCATSPVIESSSNIADFSSQIWRGLGPSLRHSRTVRKIITRVTQLPETMRPVLQSTITTSWHQARKQSSNILEWANYQAIKGREWYHQAQPEIIDRVASIKQHWKQHWDEVNTRGTERARERAARAARAATRLDERHARWAKEGKRFLHSIAKQHVPVKKARTRAVAVKERFFAWVSSFRQERPAASGEYRMKGTGEGHGRRYPKFGW